MERAASVNRRSWFLSRRREPHHSVTGPRARPPGLASQSRAHCSDSQPLACPLETLRPINNLYPVHPKVCCSHTRLPRPMRGWLRAMMWCGGGGGRAARDEEEGGAARKPAVPRTCCAQRARSTRSSFCKWPREIDTSYTLLFPKV